MPKRRRPNYDRLVRHIIRSREETLTCYHDWTDETGGEEPPSGLTMALFEESDRLCRDLAAAGWIRLNEHGKWEFVPGDER